MIDNNCPECKFTGCQYFKSGQISFLHCNHCGIVWRHPIPSELQLSEIYRIAYSAENINIGTTNQESGDFATKAYSKYLDKYLIRNDDKNLDYGAATGSLVLALRQLGLDCDGYEYSSDAREFCYKQNGIKLFNSPDLIPHNHYNLITMIEVIEHLRNPGEIMLNLRSVLQPGGRIFLTTPNRKSWRARLEGGEWCEAVKPFHLYLFDESSLTQLLVNSGFKVERRIRFTPHTRPGYLRSIWLRCMQLLGFGGTLCIVARRQEQQC